MKFNEDIKNNICFLVSTFDEREKFLSPFFYFYKKFIGPELRVYLAKGDNHFSCDEDVNIRQLNFSLPRSNRNLGLCSSWGRRLKLAIEQIKQDGFPYIVFTCDDGWIRYLDADRFSLLLGMMKKYDCDRMQLIETSPGYILEKIDEHVSLISPYSDVPWYLNHQTSIWKTDSLFNVINENDCATESEMIGSKRCKELNYKFLVLSKPLISSSGVNHSVDGLYDYGKEMLKDFCYEKELSYSDYYKKFRISISNKIANDIKSLIIQIIRKLNHVGHK